MNYSWNRRAWLQRQAATTAALMVRFPRSRWRSAPVPHDQATRTATHIHLLEREPLQTLVLQGVDAARAAGAHYADARFTRDVSHYYNLADTGLSSDIERVGIGVRVLVDGYWGFAAVPYCTSEEIVRLARAAVVQAKENAKGRPRAVELGQVPVVTGTWTTPVKIDPFTISIEEKEDFIAYWKECARKFGSSYVMEGQTSWLLFGRQERVLATSEGSLIAQTMYESGGDMNMTIDALFLGFGGGPEAGYQIKNITMAGSGWERLLDAEIPDQFVVQRAEVKQRLSVGGKPSTIGRYTLVCDGVAMASLVERTLGQATQLDRAMGYEANAQGTSFLDDPLAMVGHLQVTTPLVNVTANRSAPQQLATVKWDDEGVTPPDFTIIKDGVLVDFQTTREQAAWLAPYYQQQGTPVQSHGCAIAQDALAITMQNTPNLVMEPSPSAIRVEDLIADVKDGIYVEGGTARCDFQARTGEFEPQQMREIKNGRLGKILTGGSVILFNSTDLWKRNLVAVGGPTTQGEIGTSKYSDEINWVQAANRGRLMKGEPAQDTSYSVRAVAATITNQPLINIRSKA